MEGRQPVGWFARYWLRGTALLTTLVLATGTAMWTVTPVPSAGRLVDAAGRPVSDATVAVEATPLSPAGSVRTDDRGRYQVGARRWPYEATQLTVEAPGFMPEDTAGGTLVLHRWPAVSGLVVDDEGTPLPGTVVTVATGGTVVAALLTDLDGRFRAQLPDLSGEASVTAVADEHDTGSQEVAIGADLAPAVRLSLPRQLATLHVESDPGGLAPEIDGRSATDCPATPCDVTVEAGGHQVAFVADQYIPWQADVSVDRGDTATVSAQLQRKTGTLTIATPGAGELALDGQPLNASPWSGPVPAGTHSVSFRTATTWPFTTQATVQWNQATQVAVNPTPVTPGDAAGFTSALRAYLGAQGGGSFGVYVEDLGSGASVGVGDTTVLEAASVIKLPVAIYLLRQVDAGQIALGDPVTLTPEDFMGGTGSLYVSAHPGDSYSYQQLLSLLVQQSDNTAWKALQRVLGDSRIDAYAASHGAGDCVQASDTCSARSAGHLVAQLARGALLSRSSTALLLQLLETTIFNDRINYYLGGLTIAHKVGIDSGNGVANDCGVVFQSGGGVVVCVFTTTPNPDNGVQVIRDVARAAARLY